MRDLSRLLRGWGAWLVIAVTLGAVLAMIGIGAARVGSGGQTDQSIRPTLSPPADSVAASAPDSSYAPSPDGSYARVVDLRTGEVSKLPRQIAEVPLDCCYSISPNGKRIAFVGDLGDADEPVPNCCGIFVADVDGSHVRQLANDAGTGFIGTPQWSPDGTEIAYQREGDLGIAVVDVATAVVTPITEGLRGEHAQPTFSPDGRIILFTRGYRGGRRLWTVPATGGRESVLLAPGALGTYSPDGTTIAYTWIGAKPATYTYRGIWLADADGGQQRPVQDLYSGVLMGVPSLQELSRAVWSPDGTRIAASLADGSPVVVVDLRTRKSQEVAERGQPAWLDDHTLIIGDYERVHRRGAR